MLRASLKISNNKILIHCLPDNLQQLHVRQPSILYKTRGCLCSFRLLMMGGVWPETCWATFKIRNNKILIHSCILLGFFTVSKYPLLTLCYINYRPSIFPVISDCYWRRKCFEILRNYKSVAKKQSITQEGWPGTDSYVNNTWTQKTSATE